MVKGRPNLQILCSLKVLFDFNIWGDGICTQKRSILNLPIVDVSQIEGRENKGFSEPPFSFCTIPLLNVLQCLSLLQ